MSGVRFMVLLLVDDDDGLLRDENKSVIEFLVKVDCVDIFLLLLKILFKKNRFDEKKIKG